MTATFVDRWSPLIGQDAARLQNRTSHICGGSAFGFVASMALAVLTRSSGVHTVFLGLAALCASVFLFGVVLRHWYYQAMSRHFGIHVWCLNSPTFQPEAFQAWCEKNAVSPPKNAAS